VQPPAAVAARHRTIAVRPGRSIAVQSWSRAQAKREGS
jgi:hypothetical protein